MKFHKKYFVVLLFMVGVVLNNAVLFNLEAMEHVNECDAAEYCTILRTTFTEEELQLIEAVGNSTEQTVDIAADAPAELVCCWVVSQEKGKSPKKNICAASFSTIEELDAHSQQHVMQYHKFHRGNDLYYCQWQGCKAVLLNKKRRGLWSLRRHICACHTHYKKYVCSYPGCDKTFADCSNLREHESCVHRGKKRIRNR